MDLRQRGVAHVNIFWALVPMVLFIGAGAYGYFKHADNDRLHEERTKAVRDLRVKQDEVDFKGRQLDALTVLLSLKGVFTATVAGEDLGTTHDYSSPTKLERYLSSLKRDLGIAASVTTLPEILSAVQEIVRKNNTTETNLKVSLRDAGATIASKVEENAQLTTELTDKISTLEEQKTQAEQNMDSQVGLKEAELATARKQTTKARDDLNAANAAHVVAVDTLNSTLTQVQAANDTIVQKLKLINPASEPDGAVIESSDQLHQAWINLGSVDMIPNGLSFRILGRRGSGRYIKGQGRVIKVERNRSLMHFTNVDNHDPVVRGDLIANDLYSKGLKRNIYLAGRFVTPYTKGELKRLLENMGNTVFDKMSSSVDLMIIGRDPIGEDAVKIEDSPAYKMAETNRIEIAPLHKLKDFLKL